MAPLTHNEPVNMKDQRLTANQAVRLWNRQYLGDVCLSRNGREILISG